MFTGTRLAIARKILRKRLTALRRKKQLFDFASARYVGIVCGSENEADVRILKDFLLFLRGQGIRYLVLGYFDGTKIPNNFLYAKGIDFITRKDLSLFRIPEGEVVKSFIKQPFDMLINCNIGRFFPVDCIMQLSMASCKVGSLAEGPYDVAIDVGGKNSLGYFLDNVKLYLTRLRNTG